MFNLKTISAVLLMTSAPTVAQSEQDAVASRSNAPERISFLVTFGDDKCPESIGNEIVVCAAAPESERYRIPKELRTTDDVTGETSWTTAVENLDEYARAGRPDSCSVNGSGGFTGCTQAMLRDWFAERRGR